MSVWTWNEFVGGYCLQLTNNSELQMFIDDDKHNKHPVAIFKAWYSFDLNENCFALFGKYETQTAANKAIRKYIRGVYA